MLNKKPLVSIITPCYNDGKYLLECIECVDRINYQNLEHIIINDGSTDLLTCEILKQVEQTETRKIINTENAGVCVARQLGVLASNGKYVLPLDADDLISETYISQAVELLEKSDDLKLVTTNYKLFGEVNKFIEVESFSLSKLLGHNLYCNSSIFKRSDFDNIGGYSIYMKDGLEDWEFWIKLLESGGEVKITEGVNYFYRIKKTKYSRNASVDEEKRRKLRRVIWENHKNLYSKIYPDPIFTYEFMSVVNSKEYKIGKLLLNPIRKILNR